MTTARAHLDDAQVHRLALESIVQPFVDALAAETPAITLAVLLPFEAGFAEALANGGGLGDPLDDPPEPVDASTPSIQLLPIALVPAEASSPDAARATATISIAIVVPAPCAVADPWAPARLAARARRAWDEATFSNDAALWKVGAPHRIRLGTIAIAHQLMPEDERGTTVVLIDAPAIVERRGTNPSTESVLSPFAAALPPALEDPSP